MSDSSPIKGLGDLHESALVERLNCVKQKVSRYFTLGGQSWGTDAQADSFRAYLGDSKCSHVMFKDSQGWTVFHLLSKLDTHISCFSYPHNCACKTLLECKVKLSFTDAEGHTDWECKSCGNDKVQVNLHLLPGLDVADVTAKGWTALHIAAAEGNRGAVECLLDSKLFAVDDMDFQGRTALQLALAGQHGGAMEALIRCTPDFKADAECRQVLTALVQEQATQGIDHDLSNTMVARLSYYHDRAWCRPTLLQGRPHNAVLSGGLADLPGKALAIIVPHLDLGELIQLDAATMAQVPVIRERRLQVQYAGRWLQLTRRMPAVARSVPIEQPVVESQQSTSADSASISDSVTDSDDSQTEAGESSELEEDDVEAYESSDPYADMTRKGREQLWGQLQQMSKHSLLETLLQQICHINDVAALVDNWVAAHMLDWHVENGKLRQWWRHADKKYSPDYTGGRQEFQARLRQLHNKVLAAFSIGRVAFSIYDSPEFAALAELEYHREFHDDLLFFCALHRLQQLPPDAALARLHSIFSRCCRFDLLLLTTCVAYWRGLADEAMSSEAHADADDMFTAFGANRQCYMDVMAQVSAPDKAKIKEHSQNG